MSTENQKNKSTDLGAFFKPSFAMSILTITAFSTMISSCLSKTTSPKTGASSLVSLSSNKLGDIPNNTDPQSVCNYIKQNGYFPTNSYPANSKVLYSSSYVSNSGGQAYGVIDSNGYFNQQGMTTGQLLVPPGASNISGGSSSWKINGNDGYLQLALDVVCNVRSRSGAAMPAGYSSLSAQKVSFVASTAGQQISGQDAVEVDLVANQATSKIVFSKGGGVGVLYDQQKYDQQKYDQQNLTPAGTAEVFISPNGAQSSAVDPSSQSDNTSLKIK